MTDETTETFLREAPASREAQYAALFAALDAAESNDWEPDEAIEESILSIESTRGFEVTISTGGPGEWLECTVDSDDGLESVEFVCAWWSAPSRTRVYPGSALWRLAERMNPYA